MPTVETASGTAARRNLLDMPSTQVRAGQVFNLVYRAEGTLSRVVRLTPPVDYAAAIMARVHQGGAGASVFVVGNVAKTGEGYGVTVKIKQWTQGHTVDGVFSPLKSFSGLTLMSVTVANLGTKTPATAADATAAVSRDFPPRDNIVSGIGKALGGVGSSIGGVFSKITLLAIVLTVLVGLVFFGPELKAGLGKVTK